MSEQTNGPQEPLKGLDGMRRADQLRLVAEVLDFFATDPTSPQARPIRELTADPRFGGFKPTALDRLVKCLLAAGLIYRPPQLATRGAAYVTTREGQQLRDEYLRQLPSVDG